MDPACVGLRGSLNASDGAFVVPAVSLRSSTAADSIISSRASWLQDGLSSGPPASRLPAAAGQEPNLSDDAQPPPPETVPTAARAQRHVHLPSSASERPFTGCRTQFGSTRRVFSSKKSLLARRREETAWGLNLLLLGVQGPPPAERRMRRSRFASTLT